MIQRIQSIYLLLIVIFYSIMLFLPIATFGDYTYSVWSIKDSTGLGGIPAYYLGLLSVIIVGVAISTILLYKNRPLQNKLCVAMFVLILVFLSLMFFVYPEFVISKMVAPEIQINYTIYSFFGVLPLAFVLLANKAIQKDEKLVKSADRLRG